MDKDAAAFVDGHIEPSEDFDWDAVDEKEKPAVETEIRRQCAITLAKFVATLLTVGGHDRRQFWLAENCLAFANHIHPSQESSGEKIAKAIGMKKPAFFRRVNQWRNILGLPAMAGAWGVEARKSISRATKKSYEHRKQNHDNRHAENITKRFSRASGSAGKGD
jgi:hypothetical protein